MQTKDARFPSCIIFQARYSKSRKYFPFTDLFCFVQTVCANLNCIQPCQPSCNIGHICGNITKTTSSSCPSPTMQKERSACFHCSTENEITERTLRFSFMLGDMEDRDKGMVTNHRVPKPCSCTSEAPITGDSCLPQSDGGGMTCPAT